jgi:hypothetical protein
VDVRKFGISEGALYRLGRGFGELLSAASLVDRRISGGVHRSADCFGLQLEGAAHLVAGVRGVAADLGA